MSVFRISYRYANSLFQLAEEKNILDTLAEDAELIYSTLYNSKELRSLLKNPVLKTDKKKEILFAVFNNISSAMKDFLNFIVDKNREDILMEIMNEFLNLIDNKKGILRAEVVSSVELDDNLKNEIISKLEKRENKKVVAKFSVNPDIVGGYIIKFRDTIIDASLIHQLERLRIKFSEDISITNN
ncbi:ATP synthase F1 subunit delta [Rosettibacter firmus]|uniref:ATP synthase F1 subunit delta n=1 Tax=Rosettibacter firmus TaxID=3111522 RepID=UPI00336BDC90